VFVFYGAAVIQGFSWTAVELFLNSGKSFWADQAYVTTLREVLTHQPVEVLNATFLPAVIGRAKITRCTKRLFNPAVFGKLKSIVISDGVDPVGLKNSDDRIGGFCAALAGKLHQLAQSTLALIYSAPL
jgi:hypothetical protein